jgi:xylose isomerase
MGSGCGKKAELVLLGLLECAMEKFGYRFSFGPWNIHEGADPFGPPVRPPVLFLEKLKTLKELGFDAMQFHDDDAVPDMDDLGPGALRQRAREMRRLLDDHGLEAEFVAPRLWEHPMTVDGAFTANDPDARAYALARAKKAADIGRELGTDLMVLWLAREGTYLREAKDAARATHQLLEAVDALLAYDPDLRIVIEPKPNEPMDLAYIPTIGHALALGFQSADPARVGALVESAHAVLAGLDPADEMAFALAFDKLWSVHLNDQNGLKFDQDRSFGSVDLRRAFNQVLVLEENGYGEKGMVGLDVKAIRTQPADRATRHLRNSLEIFLRLVEVVRGLDRNKIDGYIAARDYEALDALILAALMGR